MLEVKILTNAALAAGKLADQVEDANEAGVKAVTDLVFRHEEKQIGNIANRKIPQSRTGRPKWKRKGASGGILGGLTKTFVDRRTSTVSVEGNAKKYAARREGLGVDWTPEKPAGGVVRKNPFARRTKEIATPQIVPVYEAAFRDELDK